MTTTSTQTATDRVTEADAQAKGIDGGLNAKSDPSRLDPPATTRADNAWYLSPGTVSQLPAFASAMPAGFGHIYNLSAKDTFAPALTGDTLIHGELPDPASAFTTPVWAQSNGANPSRNQPCLPHTMRTRPFASALQQVLTGGQLQNSIAQWPVMTARQELGPTASRRFATGYYDGSQLRVTFGNQDGLTDTGETLTLFINAQWLEMIGIQGTNTWGVAYLQGSQVYISTWDFYGNPGPISARAIATNALPMASITSGVTQFPTMATFNHCQTTYVCYLAQLATANSGIASYGLYAFPFAPAPAIKLIPGPNPAQGGGPLQGFAVSSPTSHQPRGAVDYLAVAYDTYVWVVANPFGGGTTSSAKSRMLSVPATPGMSTTQGYNNGLTTVVAMPTNDGLQASTATAGVAVVVYRHVSEQATPAGINAGGVAYQYVVVDNLSCVAGALTLIGSNTFRSVGGAAICAKAFAINPSEANYAGAQAAVQGYCVVRQGAWQPSFGYNGDTGIGRYWMYDQPTYFLIDHQARIVARWAEGTAPIGPPTDLAACTPYSSSVTQLARFPLCTSLGHVLISDTLATPNDLTCLDIVLPTWNMAQLTRADVARIGTGLTSTTTPIYAVASPMAAVLSLSSTASTPPTVSGHSYTVASGCMTLVHDGRLLIEAGFHNQTNNLSVVPLNQGDTGASPTQLGGAGFYYYQANWEWTDAQGRVHRSRPSRAAYCFPSSTFWGARVTVPSPSSVRGAGNTSVLVRLYRTNLGNTDGKYYLVATQQVPCLNVQGASPVGVYGTEIYDAAYPDATSAPTPTSAFAVQFLQNQGSPYNGVGSANAGRYYPSDPPAPFVWQAASRGRAFGLAVVQGQPRLYYSSVATSGVAMEWHALNYVPIPPELGDVRSIDALDDKILAFGSRLVGFVSGDGPPGYNSTGNPSPGDGFGPVYPIPTSLGVIGNGAPCRMADGIVFQGSSGFQLIGRDLTVNPAGAQVDLITGRQVGNMGQVYCRGVMVSTLQSIVWTNPMGPALLFNYLTKKWSTWPLLPGATSISQRFDGTVTVAMQPITAGKYAGRATASTPGVDMGTLGQTYSPIYQGNSQAPGLVLETPWICPSGESGGESALFDVALTGSYYGPHVIAVEQGYNYGPYQAQVTRFSVPSAPQVYQFRVRPIGGTRLWAVRYRISLLPMTSLQAGYNMAGLSDLVIFAGNKQGTTRLLAGQSG